ncbi:MAG: hypothetical protein H2184_08580 [Candidatus Galacturonibacter soehngenii]|nr:hypothetical protein [Candidatus Galacturonibacter soehngenii]
MDIDRMNSRPYNNIYGRIGNFDVIMLSGILIIVIGLIILLKAHFSLKTYSKKRYVLPICMILCGVLISILSFV